MNGDCVVIVDVQSAVNHVNSGPASTEEAGCVISGIDNAATVNVNTTVNHCGCIERAGISRIDHAVIVDVEQSIEDSNRD